jgi:hypothetical protein
MSTEKPACGRGQPNVQARHLETSPRGGSLQKGATAPAALRMRRAQEGARGAGAKAPGACPERRAQRGPRRQAFGGQGRRSACRRKQLGKHTGAADGEVDLSKGRDMQRPRAERGYQSHVVGHRTEIETSWEAKLRRGKFPERNP